MSQTAGRRGGRKRRLIITSSTLSVNFQSRELITKQIMETLKDENVSKIGICGMGGVGKTTLVNEISMQAIKNELFDMVAIAVVSQTQNYVQIQGEIAKMLGFTQLPDDDETVRASFLWYKIKEKQKTMQKKKGEMPKLIVLTSRIKDVCIEMNVKTFILEFYQKKVLGPFQTSPLPPSLQLPANLTTLRLKNCIFGAAGVSLNGKLTNLKILSLRGTDIAEIPQDFGKLVKLRFFLFEKMSISWTNTTCYHILPQAIRGAIILHISTGEAGPNNSLELGHVILSNRMPFLNITSFVIKIGYKYNQLEQSPLPWSKILYIKSILIEVTTELQLCKIVGIHGFNDLKLLELTHCQEITYLLGTLEYTLYRGFNSVGSLLTEHIPNLVNLFHGPLPAESFCKLQEMYMWNYNKMLTIIPSHLLQRLHSLEDFDARSCYSVIYFLSSLKRIILFDLCEIIQIWNGDATLISLCNLTTISVYHCSKLRQVFPPPLLQSLVSLEIIDCNSLEEIFGKEEEEDQENEIVALKIDHTAVSLGCHKLKNLFTPAIVKGLVQLKTLKVELFRTLEDIISDEKAETGGSTESITQPHLFLCKAMYRRIPSFGISEHTRMSQTRDLCPWRPSGAQAECDSS
ncbi:hypothetical protein ACOSQ3_003064 [Xanthoceras sorbifolium]